MKQNQYRYKKKYMVNKPAKLWQQLGSNRKKLDLSDLFTIQDNLHVVIQLAQ